MPQIMVSSNDIPLLRKEIEAQGELLENEKLERVADVDRLRLEVEAIRDTLAKLVPGFDDQYQACFADLLQNFNPETRTKSA